MSNFFNDVANDITKLEKEFLGPKYPYQKYIRSPTEMGMSGDGSMKALNNDISGIVNYVNLLVSGKSYASKTGGPLGDRFFLKTGGQCKDVKSKKLVPRSMYVNNVPTGVVNFIPLMPSMKVGDSFRGIVPGIFNDLGSINPLAMFSAFMQGNEPACASVTLRTIDENNRASKQTAFVPINELRQLENDGDIPKGTVTSQMIREMNDSSTTKEAFLNMCLNNKLTESSSLLKKEDNFQTLYYSSVAALVLYLFYRLLRKSE